MMKRKFTEKFKNKVAIVGAIAFMAVAAAVVGTNMISSNHTAKDNSNLVDLNELPDSTNDATQDNKVNTVADENVQANHYNSEEFGMDNVMDATDEVKETTDETAQLNKSAVNENEEKKDEKNEEKDTTKENEVKETNAPVASTKAVNFQPENKMTWPISGNVLINYSMDSTVYFATLNQYKYNPALIIQGDVNSKVLSAADGVVEDVYTDEETGISMKVDLGNGYEAIYGQLKEAAVKKGDTISKGSIIGYISEPTKYYSIEGSNLYFKVMKDDTPVNPLDFLE